MFLHHKPLNVACHSPDLHETPATWKGQVFGGLVEEKKSKRKKAKQPKTGFTGDKTGFYSIKPGFIHFHFI